MQPTLRPRRARKSRLLLGAAGAALATSLLAAGGPAAATTTATAVVDEAPRAVIVRSLVGDTAMAHGALVRVGGSVDTQFGIIAAVAGSATPSQVAELAAMPGIVVTDDQGIEFHNADQAYVGMADTLPTSFDDIRDNTRMIDMWGNPTGEGIDVAVIDTGISPVPGLDDVGQVVNGPDISFDAGNPNLSHLDGYGHGTHMAGIIAATPDATGSAGIAPGARIVNVKVGAGNGATDVSQVISAIDWVVQNQDSGDLDIRVMLLAYGTDGAQDPSIDPLVAAVEAAWDSGIVVVVAGGNAGAEGMTNPATSPLVISVAASDTNRTVEVGDDTVPTWSSEGSGTRNPDLVAPGKSVVSLRVPGSYLDYHYGDVARYGEHGFKGSGTSQSSAVVAGLAALILDEEPTLTPDQVKFILRKATRSFGEVNERQGEGLIDGTMASNYAKRMAAATDTSHINQDDKVRSNASGTLEGARGSVHVTYTDDHGNLQTLQGETTAWGTAWTGGTWSGGTWSGGTWSGGTWSGGTWSGGTWSGGTWSGGTWSGGTWSGGTWSGGTWSGAEWK